MINKSPFKWSLSNGVITRTVNGINHGQFNIGDASTVLSIIKGLDDDLWELRKAHSQLREENDTLKDEIRNVLESFS